MNLRHRLTKYDQRAQKKRSIHATFIRSSNRWFFNRLARSHQKTSTHSPACVANRLQQAWHEYQRPDWTTESRQSPSWRELPQRDEGPGGCRSPPAPSTREAPVRGSWQPLSPTQESRLAIPPAGLINFTSGSRITPHRSATCLRASRISALTSSAVPSPRLMK